MDWDIVGILTIICILFMVAVLEVIVVVVVSGYIATLFGATGITWWCIAIVVFLLLNGVLGAIGRMGLE